MEDKEYYEIVKKENETAWGGYRKAKLALRFFQWGYVTIAGLGFAGLAFHDFLMMAKKGYLGRAMLGVVMDALLRAVWPLIWLNRAWGGLL